MPLYDRDNLPQGVTLPAAARPTMTPQEIEAARIEVPEDNTVYSAAEFAAALD